MGASVPQQAPTAVAKSESEAPRLPGRRFFLLAMFGSWFFTGYFPIAPATVTSLVVMPMAFLLARWKPWWQLLPIVVFFIVGVPAATRLERVWGHDPARVTIDEVVGALATFFMNPVSIWGLGVGFLLWRFFDIIKLPFVDRAQRLPGGWGIMMDDLLAGVCANLALRLILLVPAFSCLRCP